MWHGAWGIEHGAWIKDEVVDEFSHSPTPAVETGFPPILL